MSGAIISLVAIEAGIGAGLTALTAYTFNEAGWDGSIEAAAGIGALVGMFAYAINFIAYLGASSGRPTNTKEAWQILGCCAAMGLLYPGTAFFWAYATDMQGDEMVFTGVTATVAGLLFSAFMFIYLYNTYSAHLKTKQEHELKSITASESKPLVTSTANTTGNENPLLFTVLGINSDPTGQVPEKSLFNRLNPFKS